MKKVVHIISLLKELGGVQQAFISYYKYAQKHSEFKQCIFSNHSISKKYGHFNNFYKINKNFINFLKHLYSKDSIIYFHNKLSSKKVFYLLKFLPINNIIFHEHGTAWNVKSQNHKEIFKSNAKLAKKIIVNSNATKNFLIKRFKISKNKIRLAYYGFNDPKIKKKHKKSNKIKIGYIGRFVSFKGIQSLIEAAYLLKNKNINFLIAGDGYLKEDLKKLSKNNNKIKFVGNISKPLNFIKKLDILVVPSIREPLGIVNIEAGLCKIPVIASNVDGIPEVVTNNYSGILIKPTKKITLKKYQNQPPLPDFVINPDTFQLVKPKQLDPQILSNRILFLSKNKKLRIEYGKQLYQQVSKKFSIKRYFEKLEEIYKQI
tara:strand:+ start:1017 stop:2138 length:1122 start_codon:yes stop_codon:yes gene_type:complete